MFKLNRTTIAIALICLSTLFASISHAADSSTRFAEHEVWGLVDLGIIDEAEAWEILDAQRQVDYQVKPKQKLPSSGSTLSGTDLGSSR